MPAAGSVPLFLAGAFLVRDAGKARDCGLYLRPIVGATEKRRAWARGSRSVIGIKRSGRRGRVVDQPQGGVFIVVVVTEGWVRTVASGTAF